MPANCSIEETGTKSIIIRTGEWKICYSTVGSIVR